jgi:hypothetical protein
VGTALEIEATGGISGGGSGGTDTKSLLFTTFEQAHAALAATQSLCMLKQCRAHRRMH